MISLGKKRRGKKSSSRNYLVVSHRRRQFVTQNSANDWVRSWRLQWNLRWSPRGATGEATPALHLVERMEVVDTRGIHAAEERGRE
jgi:hypothetical protein